MGRDGTDAGRRRFLREVTALLLAAPAATWAAACARPRDPGGDLPGSDLPQADPGGDGDVPQDAPAPPARTLSEARFACLAALVDALVPGDDAAAGASRAGAAEYVDGLLGAFASDPPRIFAGGPYSGRHGGLDGFGTFLPLTRVEELAWRIRLEGSRGMAEREFAGPVKGFLQRYEEGLDALDAAARDYGGTPFADLSPDDRRALLYGTDAPPVEDVRDLAYGHAVEGTYGDPVYGGNRDGLGWKAIDYEGDRQPLGYTARQMSHPEEG